MENKEIKPIAIPGIHSRFYKFFKKITENNTTLRVLDIGAGHGAFARRLFNNGFKVEACDLHPENFHFDGIDCKKADVLTRLPYDEGSFDVVLAIEVVEHIFDHEKFFIECHRILKEEGLLLISTPNILSLKSRFRFLFTGFFYSFKPLDLDTIDGFQHVSALTLDQYRYLGRKNGLFLEEVSFDRLQNSSVSLLFMWPFLWIYSKFFKVDFNVHNRLGQLVGRILFLKYVKK